MESARHCPDCRVEMVRGFLPDATYGAHLAATWHPGEPEDKSFLGMPAGKKVSGYRTRNVEAHRCPQCGLVRLYAPDGPPRRA